MLGFESFEYSFLPLNTNIIFSSANFLIGEKISALPEYQRTITILAKVVSKTNL